MDIIKHGGSAVIAETDELIGAEPYMLDKVRDFDTAARFVGMVARFSEQVGRHGHSAEGNPSGGNNYRGLYNIRFVFLLSPSFSLSPFLSVCSELP